MTSPSPSRATARPPHDPRLIARVIPKTFVEAWRGTWAPAERAALLTARLAAAPAEARTLWADVLWTQLPTLASGQSAMSTSDRTQREDRMQLMGGLFVLVPWSADQFIQAVRFAGSPATDRDWRRFTFLIDVLLDPATAPARGQALAAALTRTGGTRLPLKVRDSLRKSMGYFGHTAADRMRLTEALAGAANAQPVWQGAGVLTHAEVKDLNALYTTTAHQMTPEDALALAPRLVCSTPLATSLGVDILRRAGNRAWQAGHALLAANRGSWQTLRACLGLHTEIKTGQWLDHSFVNAVAGALRALPTAEATDACTMAGHFVLQSMCTHGFWVCPDATGYATLALVSTQCPKAWYTEEVTPLLRTWLQRLVSRQTPPDPLPADLLHALLSHPSADVRHAAMIDLVPLQSPAPTTGRTSSGRRP